jgi:DNA polymerase
VEIRACHPWLTAELAVVGPRMVVALGATAAQTLAGASFRVTRQRGKVLDWPPGAPYPGEDTARFLATIHPSAVLRSDNRERAYRGFVDDLTVVAEILGDAG